MRILAILLFALTIPLHAATLPERRPALIGAGSDSLVNLIDSAGLMKQGQRDAWVMFDCVVDTGGRAGRVVQYRVSPDAQLLQREVSRKLKRAKFIPAANKGRLVNIGISGTAIFVLQNGRPRLRIYLNQEMDELKRGSDFIAPQLLGQPGYSFPGHASYLGLSSTVKIRLSVDAEGKITEVKALGDTMPGEGFGEAAEWSVRHSFFLPAYRNGRPVASVTTLDYHFYGRSYIE